MHDILKRTWAEINLNKIEHNWKTIRNIVSDNAKMMAVIKADGYGHGAVELAKTYEKLGADWFAVSNLDEALQLRRSGITRPILILGFTPVECVKTLAQENISQTVLDEQYAKQLSAQAQKDNVNVKIHVKIDTGMTRIGFYYHDKEKDYKTIDLIADVCKFNNLIPEGIFTHFASADEGENGLEYTQNQFELFTDVISKLSQLNINFEYRHCCNSAGLSEHENYHLDMVRPGIILYGLAPSSQAKKIDISPAMQLKSIISMVKFIPKNTKISYNGIFISPKDMKIATVPIGYADGYPRLLSNKGEVLVCSKRAKIVGRICMDQLMIDVTDIPDAKAGCVVTLVGEDENEKITLDEIANELGTINYELACNISKRVPRVYIKDGKVIENSCYIF